MPVNPKYIAPLKLTMNQAKGALRARSFSTASWQIPGTWSIFFDGRESQLTRGVFGFRWNAQIKKLYKRALVPVNAKYIAPQKCTMNQGKGALRARTFAAAPWQIPGTWGIFFDGRRPYLTPGAFGFRWNAKIYFFYNLALVPVNAKYIDLLKLTMN